MQATASWNVAEQKLVLTSVPNGGQSQFTIADVPTPAGAGVPPATTAATTSANFLETFHLQTQGDTINNLSTQIGGGLAQKFQADLPFIQQIVYGLAVLLFLYLRPAGVASLIRSHRLSPAGPETLKEVR